MEKRKFIDILDNMLKNTDDYIKMNVSGIGSGYNDFSKLEFKTSNKELFQMIKEHSEILGKSDNYLFIADENNGHWDSYKIIEKNSRNNESGSSESIKSNLNATKEFFNIILNAANKDNLITIEEKEMYLNVVKDNFKYTSPIEWIKATYKAAKTTVQSITRNKRS